MIRSTSTRRHCVLAILETLALVATMVAILAPAAGAAGKKTCWVKNTTLAKSYGPATGSVLQGAIDAAQSGNRLEVRGFCVGNFTIGKDLVLVGVAKDGYPVATMDGNYSGRPLSIGSGASVTITNLTITNGDLSGNVFPDTYGGGIFNGGTLTLNDSSVSGNTAGLGGGILNDGIFSHGTLTLNDSSVSGNTAGLDVGGIYNYGGTLTLAGASSVSGNTTEGDGGGIYNAPGGTLTLNGSASVSGNTANRGGGIFNLGATLTMNDSASVSGNTANTSSSVAGDSANTGGGIFNLGTVALNDSSSVSGNTAKRNGGGIVNAGTLTLNASSSVSGNTTEGDGGGIYAYSAPGSVTLNGSSSVTGNRADFDNDNVGTGGGIYGCATNAVDGGNVNDNYLGPTGTNEDNLAGCT